MDNENVYDQEEVTDQEEEVTTSDEQSDDDESEDVIEVSKSEFKALKRKAIAYDANKGNSEKREKPLQEKSESGNISPERFERLELMAEGYSKDEVEEIMSLGGKKVVDSKIVQAAIKTMRAEKKSKEASDEVSPKSPIYKKFTQEDMQNMSSAELEKILPKDY